MQTLDISLPDPLKRYLDRQAAEGGYRSASDYVLDLIQADERRKAQAALIEGLDGAEVEMDAEDWAALRCEGPKAGASRPGSNSTFELTVQQRGEKHRGSAASARPGEA